MRLKIYFLLLPPLTLLAAGERRTEGNPNLPRLNSELTIPVFTPPLKKQPPLFGRLVSSSHLRHGNAIHTLAMGEASVLPDIPAPPVLPQAANTAPSKPADFLPHVVLHISVEVIAKRVSYVRWRHPTTGEELSALCGYDFSLLANAPDFTSGETTYSVIMLPWHDPTPEKLASVPRINSDSYRIISGDPEDPAATRLIEVMHALYLVEKPALILTAQAHEKYSADRDKWLKANPPEVPYHTLMLRPHRSSRYLPRSGGDLRSPSLTPAKRAK